MPMMMYNGVPYGSLGVEIVSLTYAEYEALTEAQKMDASKVYDITDMAGGVVFGNTDISKIGDGTVTGAIAAVNNKVKNFGIIEIDVSGTAINKQDPGMPGYYVHVDISDKLPEGAVPFSATLGAYDVPVAVDVLHGRNAISLRSDAAYTIGTTFKRRVYVHYYM